MKNKTIFIPIVVSFLVMLSFMFIIDSRPERHVSLKESERKADTVSIRMQVVDSLFRQFSLLNNLQILKDDKGEDAYTVTVKNLNAPEDILGKDWKNVGLTDAALQREGFSVKVSEARPYDVVLTMRRKDDFIVVPAGVLFRLLYPKN